MCRGHEAAAHGRRWEYQDLLDPDEEHDWITDSGRSIENATGTTPRNTPLAAGSAGAPR